MILYTDQIFITDEKEGFRICRETRTTSTATMTVILCEKGYLDVWFHEKMIRINAGELFVRIPDPNHKLGPYELSPDLEFKQVTVGADIFDKVMFQHMRIEPNWYVKQEYVKEHPVYPLSDTSKEFFHTYFKLLTLQLNDVTTDYRLQVLKMIARGATMEMLNYLDKLSVIPHTDNDRDSVNLSDYTFREFTKLLYRFPHKREVQWFAEQLDISPKYLSEICKEHSGKSAGEWIAETTVIELKHLLHDTTLPIHEIAIQMEFPNASFFSQYTKKHTGYTPNQFRRLKHD